MAQEQLSELQSTDANPSVGAGDGREVMAAPINGTSNIRLISPAQMSAVAQQVAVAVQHTPNGVTELVLDPQELGRVRLSMTGLDNGMSMIVTTERLETQDLLRRHIDVLAQEMKALGFRDISMTFENHPNHAREENTRNDSDGEQIEFDLSREELEVARIDVMTTGLDLRL